MDLDAQAEEDINEDIMKDLGSDVKQDIQQDAEQRNISADSLTTFAQGSKQRQQESQ